MNSMDEVIYKEVKLFIKNITAEYGIDIDGSDDYRMGFADGLKWAKKYHEKVQPK